MKPLKTVLLLCSFVFLMSCKEEHKKTAIEDKALPSVTDSVPHKDASPTKTVYETSTFADPKSANKFGVGDDLKELNIAGVFDSIHSTQITRLSDIHFSTLKSLGKNYKLLYIAQGSLFAPGNKDMAIVAYQPDENYLTILLYNDSNGDIGELYKHYKVANGLTNANCHYSAFGTLDYQLASEIIYRKDYLLKNPKSSLFDDAPCIIGDFTKNENYAPEGGCFSPDAPKAPGSVLSITTSFVYNNWECLKYDKKTDSFLIYYGQAFAD